MSDSQPKKKKPYPGAPDIIFEDFSLSVDISAGCEVTSTNFASQYECGYISSTGRTVFSYPYISGCDKRGYTDGYNDPGDNPDMGTICRGIWGDDGNPALFTS